MRRSAFVALAVFACVQWVSASAGEEDSVAAVFVFGRASGWTASGFAVGDGSCVLTSIDAVREPTPWGARLPVNQPVVASRWTGEAYPARVAAVDEQKKLALLKLEKPAIPPVAIAAQQAFVRAPRVTLGQLLSGDEVGGRFPTEMFALDVERKPARFTVKNWRGTNACLTEIRGQDWLFLSRVNPPEKAAKGALVSRAGVGALGMFFGRLVVEGGTRPVTFYQVQPAAVLQAFLSGPQAPAVARSQAAFAEPKAADAESSFQAVCLALSASSIGSPLAAENAAAAVKLRPKSAFAHMLLGTALVNQGKRDDGIKEMNDALTLDPHLPGALLNRGLALAAAGKAAEAERDLRQAMKDDPDDHRPPMALAELLAGKDPESKEALTLAKDAVRLSSNDPRVRIGLARILKRRKDFDAAIAHLRSVLEGAPKWAEAHAALAATYEAAGKVDLAETEYRKLVELDPENPDAHLTLIDFLITAGKKDAARQAVETVRKLKLQPEFQEALKKLEARIDGGEKKD